MALINDNEVKEILGESGIVRKDYSRRRSFIAVVVLVIIGLPLGEKTASG